MSSTINTNFRNSKMKLNKVYFWTNTIKDWKYLLKQDKYKKIIIECLEDLSNKNLINVYAFVIMPNHIHLIWQILNANGKEMPNASFNKSTAHNILKDIKLNHTQILPFFEVSETERSYRIWQRDPLAIELRSKVMFEQKMDYIHNNPLQLRWNLVKRPEDYKWSSSSYYELNDNSFTFLNHYGELF